MHCYFTWLVLILAVVVGQSPDSGTNSLSELTKHQRRVFNSLTYESLLDNINGDIGNISVSTLEDVMDLFLGDNASGEEGTTRRNRRLELTASMLAGQFDKQPTTLTRTQFLQSTLMITSCVIEQNCQLAPHENHEHDHEDEDEENHAHDHEDEDEENHGHDHENEDEENHGHGHENEDEDEENHGHDHENEDEDEENHGHENEDEENHGHENEDEENHGHDHEDEDEENHGHDHENEDEDEENHGHGHVDEKHAHGLDEDDNLDSHGHDSHDHEDDEDDDDTFVIKIIALLVLFVESIIGAIIPMFIGNIDHFKGILSIVNCFAGGVLFATGVVHLIPHVVEYENEVSGIGDYHLGLVIVVFSFALVFYIEHVFFDVHTLTEPLTVDESTSTNPQQVSESPQARILVLQHSLLLLAATAVHSILEALVLGLEDDDYGVWILFASIAGHKGVTAMALSSRLHKSGGTLRESIACAGLFALTAPIGILIGTTISNVPNMTNLILTSMSTGTFLYIGAYEVISEEFQETESNSATIKDEKSISSTKKSRHLKFFAIVFGMLVISLVALTPHPEHGDHNH